MRSASGLLGSGVEVLQAELQEVEAAWERFVIARQTVAEVLAEPPVGEEASLAGVAGERPAQVAGAVPGAMVRAWREGLSLDSLPPDCQRLVEVLAGSGEEMDCRKLVAALGLEVVAAKVEGVRSKVKRLAAGLDGRGTSGDGRRARRASRRLMPCRPGDRPTESADSNSRSSRSIEKRLVSALSARSPLLCRGCRERSGPRGSVPR